MDGILLGVATYIGLLLIFLKFPTWLQDLLIRFNLFTDILGSILAFIMLTSISKSAVSVIGSIVAGLLIGSSLWVVKNIQARKKSGRSSAG